MRALRDRLENTILQVPHTVASGPRSRGCRTRATSPSIASRPRRCCIGHGSVGHLRFQRIGLHHRLAEPLPRFNRHGHQTRARPAAACAFSLVVYNTGGGSRFTCWNTCPGHRQVARRFAAPRQGAGDQNFARTCGPDALTGSAAASNLSCFMNTNPHVAIVGATGAVGVEMLATLEKRKFPVGELTLLASARSAGRA